MVGTLDMRTLVVVVFALLSRVASAEIVDGKRLEQALLQLPDTKLDPDFASQLVTAAIATDLDPFVVLAQQFIESRFDPNATSRLIDGTRQTGRWGSRRAPIGWSGNLYCGIAQTVATTWSACLALRDPAAAVAAQATELRAWLRVCRNDLSCALSGYGAGFVGVKNSPTRYARRVQALARKLATKRYYKGNDV